ncbi:G-D-S-L family lipolytic protein [Echinicola strongylocentroti]|uniref:G-D-S-L family lipolytic protein n=1 Tax=Echinicola strongylocentroti TaxID=1795355 RepID=A0A2Z4ILV7_9BACT|nr:GDSL-type esterase/lipase family protein [Echinicola strongylocentroti]AWW31699.1 G-D-S-L family lipolytic protein [Echinicola strongylocentroti]
MPIPSSFTRNQGLLLILLQIAFTQTLSAQDKPEKFQKEVDQIVTDTPVPSGDVYLFTGSSSVRMWKDINRYFPDVTVVNTGFGGSQTFELLHYADELIIRYAPHKVFIYEGDNDLASGKTPVTILTTMQKLVGKLQAELPNTEIVLISPKPSPSRWQLKEDYESLNRLLEVYADKTSGVEFVNVWDIALNEGGKPKPEIFLSDSLHMTELGYDGWAEMLDPHIP